jgi:hypothetical protein
MNFRVVHVLRLVAMALWPGVVFASGITLGQTVGSIGVADLAAVIGLSTFSGAVALLQRIDREKIAVVSFWWSLTQILASVLAGGVAFVLGELGDAPDLLELIAITGAAWTGTRYVDQVLSRISGLDKSPGAPS